MAVQVLDVTNVIQTGCYLLDLHLLYYRRNALCSRRNRSKMANALNKLKFIVFRCTATIKYNNNTMLPLHIILLFVLQ